MIDSDTHSAIDALSDSQVSTLLAFGLGPSPARSRESVLDLLCEAASEAQGDALKLLLADLKRPIDQPDDGPLSFARLSGAASAELKALVSQTFLGALSSPSTDRRALEALGRYGEALSSETLPKATRLFGGVVRVLALAALVRRCDSEVDPGRRAELAEILQTLAAIPLLPQSLRDEASRSSTTMREPERDEE